MFGDTFYRPPTKGYVQRYFAPRPIPPILELLDGPADEGTQKLPSLEMMLRERVIQALQRGAQKMLTGGLLTPVQFAADLRDETQWILNAYPWMVGNDAGQVEALIIRESNLYYEHYNALLAWQYELYDRSSLPVPANCPPRPAGYVPPIVISGPGLV